MQSYCLFAPAKINLHLEIIGDRPDGYHELVMIMQSVSLGDIIRIRANGREEIRLFCNHPQVPLDDTNLAYKAARKMQQEYPNASSREGGIDITIEKNIPVAAGLAGGSTDAAAVLVGINLLWKLGLTVPELQQIGATLGSDVPFCISGGTALATGRGEKIEPLPDLQNLWVVLAKYESLSVSTPWAYKTYRERYSHQYLSNPEDIQRRAHQIHSGDLVKAISQNNARQIGALLYNDLEKVVLPAYPAVAELIEAFKRKNVLGCIMSGSGPTVFALCESQSQGEEVISQVTAEIDNPDLHCWLTQVCPHGIITVEK